MGTSSSTKKKYKGKARTSNGVTAIPKDEATVRPLTNLEENVKESIAVSENQQQQFTGTRSRKTYQKNYDQVAESQLAEKGKQQELKFNKALKIKIKKLWKAAKSPFDLIY